MSNKEFNPDDFKGKEFTFYFKNMKIGKMKNVYYINKAAIIPSSIIIAPLILDKTKRN